MPGHQRPVIVRPDIVPVLHDKQPFHGLAELGDRGRHAVGKDVLDHPGIAGGHTLAAADGVNKGDAALLEAAIDNLHISAIVLVADVLHDADRDHGVVGAFYLAIVLQAQLDGQAPAQLHAQRDLLLGHSHPQHLGAVLFGRILGKAAPAAAQLKHAHARLEANLFADQLELGVLCLIQRGGVLPVAAGIVEALVEHGPVQVVAQVIVMLADLKGHRGGLEVQQPGA